MNLTVEMFDNMTRILDAEITARRNEEYWFYNFFTTKITPYIYCGVAAVGLAANSVVILGEFCGHSSIE